MKALGVAVLYLGSFVALGLVARAAIRRWTGSSEPSDPRAPGEPRGRQSRRFLLGSWRNDD
jgi:hypothetical protein